MNVKIEQKGIELLKEMMAWCVDNNSDEFCCFANFSGHVYNLDIDLISGGYDKPVDNYKKMNLYYGKHIDVGGSGTEHMKIVFEEMKGFKKEHDVKFSDENVAKTKDEKRLSDIAILEKKLGKLKSVDQL